MAADALRLSDGYFEAPPVVCYLDRGHGAAIRRARTRLPGGGESPVAIVRVPRERMIGSAWHYFVVTALIQKYLEPSRKATQGPLADYELVNLPIGSTRIWSGDDKQTCDIKFAYSFGKKLEQHRSAQRMPDENKWVHCRAQPFLKRPLPPFVRRPTRHWHPRAHDVVVITQTAPNIGHQRRATLTTPLWPSAVNYENLVAH